MELLEYGELLSILIPSGARYITIDKDYIKVYREKPVLKQISDKTFKWNGTCLGWTRYWDGFIDLDYITDHVDGRIDWYLAIEEITPKPWDEPRTLQKWAECLDSVLPYSSHYATVDGGKIEFWANFPSLNSTTGKWEENGGRLPHATFAYPRKMLYTLEKKGEVIDTPEGPKTTYFYSADGPRFDSYKF